MKSHLIIYAKRPLPGHTKTRLADGIGSENAAGVYARLLYSFLTQIGQTQWKVPLNITLSLASQADLPFFAHAYPEWKVCVQKKGTLGERMTTSIKDEFAAGAEKVILVGSDIPDISSVHIQQGFDILEDQDIVFGPTPDGGFYLIGTTNPSLNIFEDVAWSTPSALSTSIKNATAKKLSFSLIDELYDIDTQKEYFEWSQRLTGRTTEKE